MSTGAGSQSSLKTRREKSHIRKRVEKGSVYSYVKQQLIMLPTYPYSIVAGLNE